jgi:hypothetical protein
VRSRISPGIGRAAQSSTTATKIMMYPWVRTSVASVSRVIARSAEQEEYQGGTAGNLGFSRAGGRPDRVSGQKLIAGLASL